MNNAMTFAEHPYGLATHSFQMDLRLHDFTSFIRAVERAIASDLRKDEAHEMFLSVSTDDTGNTMSFHAALSELSNSDPSLALRVAQSLKWKGVRMELDIANPPGERVVRGSLVHVAAERGSPEFLSGLLQMGAADGQEVCTFVEHKSSTRFALTALEVTKMAQPDNADDADRLQRNTQVIRSWHAQNAAALDLDRIAQAENAIGASHGML